MRGSLISLFIGLSLLASQGAFSEDRTYYCIQLASSKKNDFSRLLNRLKGLSLPCVRVEKVRGLYTLRVGFWKSYEEAKREFSYLKNKGIKAFIRTCYFIPSRWVYSQGYCSLYEVKSKGEKVSSKEVKGEVKESSYPFSSWEREFDKVVKGLEKEYSPLPELPKVSFKKESSSSLSKNRVSFPSFGGQFYLFIDGDLFRGGSFKGCGTCKREDLYGRFGYRFFKDLPYGLNLRGDFRLGLAHQRYLSSSRNRGWLSIRELYLTNRPITGKAFSGWAFELGRVPIVEPQGFWYYNFLDGLKVYYQSTLLKGYAFLGARLNDNRIYGDEERRNIQGYRYGILRLDYQYYYRHHLGGFFLYENKPSFSDWKRFSTWKPAREKKNLKWLGLRLNGNFNGFNDYWLNLAYNWGSDGTVYSKRLDCSSSYEGLGTSFNKVHGWALDLGLKHKGLSKGLGIRLAYGQGNGDSSLFRQPLLSNNRDYLFGFNRIKYYGEFLDPDLTNLYLVSLFGGVKVSDSSWFEVNLLQYFRNKSTLRNYFASCFSPDDNGHDIGREVDLILDGSLGDKKSRFRYLLVGSLFNPGNAYRDRSLRFGVKLKLKKYW
ncbi:alginate export family protein [Thermovibrio sp.]